jgi:hypothetical protein
MSPLRAGILVALLCLGLALVPTAGGAGGVADFRECRSVGDGDGNRELVSASEIRCNRARKLARKFIRKDKLRRGWEATNPAGCEWLMFKERDADEFDEPVPQPIPGAPLIFFTKTAGCVS